jgi:hypothetical protein
MVEQVELLLMQWITAILLCQAVTLAQFHVANMDELKCEKNAYLVLAVGHF